jgi:diguanylate cyclase (GGDEF)-like protein
MPIDRRDVSRPRRSTLAIRVWGVVLLSLWSFLAPVAGATGPPATSPGWAAFEMAWFDSVTVADGLPHSTTTSIVQDSRGLIWIGTFGGLVRYDGYRMQVFGQEPGANAGAVLPDAYVRTLAALPDGGLLIGTNTGGLVRFDPAANRFLVYPVGTHGTADGKIFDLSPDERGNYWIATEGGIDHLDLASGRIDHVNGAGDAHDMVARSFSVFQDRRGDLWAGTDAGLFVRRKGEAHFARPLVENQAVADILHDQVWAIHEDSQGRLWIGTGQSGVVYLDAGRAGHMVEGLSGQHGVARRRTVRAFLETRRGQLWIATDGAGIVSYDLATGKLRTAAHDAAMPSSLVGDITRGLLQDRTGNIWVATELGAARYDPVARTVFSLLPSPLQTNALGNANVHCIYVDPRGRIWLGEGMGRVDVIDLTTGTMQHLRLRGEQAERDVQALVTAPDGSIWAGAQGISRIDPDTFQMQSSLLPSLDGKLVLSMQRDGTRVLIGGYDGLFRYDTISGTLEQFRHDPTDPQTLPSDQVRYITRMPGAWWFSTISGIGILADGAERFVRLHHDPADPASLPQDYTGSIAFDSQHRLWLGTFGGIARIDHFLPGGPFRFERIDADAGMANTKVNALLVDTKDRVWASLANGVAMIDGKTLKVRELGIRDGLRIPSYIHRVAAVAPGGELLFGGLGGLTVIRPDWNIPSWPEAEMAVTQTTINDVPTPVGRLPRDGGTIELERHQVVLRVDFALLDYRAPQETRYAYRIDGFDEHWNEVPRGNLPTAIYTNLPSGTFTLRMRATTRGLNAIARETTLRIVVVPRWYATWWARLVMLLLGVGAVFGLVSLRTLYLRQRAALLQREVESRTRDLEIANERLDQLAGTDELTGAYNRRRFLELAERVRQRATAEGATFAVVLIDIDDFKAVNDTFGHLAGDAVIRDAVQMIASFCSGGDLAGRYGGEEFILCLPRTVAARALEVTERVRKALARNAITHEGHLIHITVSAGIAIWREGEAMQAVLARADEALYEAKNDGRNRSRLAD